MRPPAVADPGPKSTSQQHVERGRDPRLRLQLRRDRLAQHLRRQGLRPRAPSRGRGRRGGEPSELIKLRLLQQLVDRGVHEPNKFYLQGAWRARGEYHELAGTHGHITLHYRAKDVNLVLSPTGDPVELMLGLQGAQLIGAANADAARPRITVTQDGAALLDTNAGADVRTVDGVATVTPSRPRMARLVSNPSFEEHELRVDVYGRGAALYAFTFTTCVA